MANFDNAEKNTATKPDDSFVGRVATVTLDWMRDEIHASLKSTCKAVKEQSQPCTTRGWFNAVLDTSFYEEDKKVEKTSN